MNTTSVTILKLLLQCPMSIEDIKRYLDLEKSGILKSIGNINNSLKKCGLTCINKNGDIYTLELEESEIEKYYNESRELSWEEKEDFLYLKILFEKFINLEEEKNILDVSRSTILRIFKNVKEILEKNGSKIEYKHGKGLVLIETSDVDKMEFCKKILKYNLLKGYISNPLKSYLKEIEGDGVKDVFNIIYEICEEIKILFNFPIFFFCAALKIAVEKFGYFEIKPFFKVSDEYFAIKKLLTEKYKFSEDYSSLLSQVISEIKVDKNWLDESIVENTRKCLKEIKKDFNIDGINEELEKTIYFKIYLGIYKKQEGILRIRKTLLKEEDKLLLNILEKSMKKVGVEIYYSDLLIVLQILKKIIIEDRLKEKNRVLILLSELTTRSYEFLIKDLEKKYPMLEVKIETALIYKFKDINSVSDYDLIISENKIANSVKIKKLNLDLFSLESVEKIIEKYAIEKSFCNLKKETA
nr:hypothetical protein [uncultured Cetobacterium sp.]